MNPPLKNLGFVKQFETTSTSKAHSSSSAVADRMLVSLGLATRSNTTANNPRPLDANSVPTTTTTSSFTQPIPPASFPAPTAAPQFLSSVKPMNSLLSGDFSLHSFKEYTTPPFKLPSLARQEEEDGDDDSTPFHRDDIIAKFNRGGESNTSMGFNVKLVAGACTNVDDLE